MYYVAFVSGLVIGIAGTVLSARAAHSWFRRRQLKQFPSAMRHAVRQGFPSRTG